eukprot:GHVU01187879.1.p2 GENE.GHVU01187879.1~~GHVU01187879.1.p2  ORF type:complete len:100 (+),score=4.67 GHVU01187879.1:642-941(+)
MIVYFLSSVFIIFPAIAVSGIKVNPCRTMMMMKRKTILISDSSSRTWLCVECWFYLYIYFALCYLVALWGEQRLGTTRELPPLVVSIHPSIKACSPSWA